MRKINELGKSNYQGLYDRRITYKLDDLVHLAGTGGSTYWLFIGEKPKAGEVPSASALWEQVTT